MGLSQDSNPQDYAGYETTETEKIPMLNGFSHTPDIAKLAEAIALASGEMGNATRDSENPFFNKPGRQAKYASLDAVVNIYQPVFAKHGLSLIQLPLGKVLVNLLLHKSGQWIRSTYEMHASKQDPQGIGSAITYARRYSAMAIAGIAPEDDDGEKAMGRGTRKTETPKRTNSAAQATITQKRELLRQVELKRGGQNSDLTHSEVLIAIIELELDKKTIDTQAELLQVRTAAIIDGRYDLDTGFAFKDSARSKP